MPSSPPRLDQAPPAPSSIGTFPPGDEERLVRVGDTLEALNDLGRAARARATDTMVIAVTGSAGKTGTKEALKLALQPSGSVHASVKSFNNHWGVPLSLANMPKAVRFGVFEIGMNHAGEIDVLTRLVRPHIAIVTTVAPVHLGFFRSVEEIADAKAEIFRGLEPGGIAIINRDNPYYERLKRHAAWPWRQDRRLRRSARCRGAADRASNFAPTAPTINGRHSRRDDRLPPRRAGPPPRAELARRACRGEDGRRRSLRLPPARLLSFTPRPAGARAL